MPRVPFSTRPVRRRPAGVVGPKMQNDTVTDGTHLSIISETSTSCAKFLIWSFRDRVNFLPRRDVHHLPVQTSCLIIDGVLCESNYRPCGCHLDNEAPMNRRVDIHVERTIFPVTDLARFLGIESLWVGRPLSCSATP